MTNAAIAPIRRFPLTSSVTFPAITAEGMTLTNTLLCQTYMPYPDGQADVIWQGNKFGLSAPAGSYITYAAVTVKHRVSVVSAFSSITAQLWAGGVPVGSPKAFTPSINYITETIVTQVGFPSANVGTLAIRLTYHQAVMGLIYVSHAAADVAYSFANSIGIIPIALNVNVASPVLTVTMPPVSLVSQGSTVQTPLPAFGQPTAAGNLLLAWVFSNSSSPTLEITCNNPTWFLVQVEGGPFAWLTLWAKPVSVSNEVAPIFSTGGSTPLAQLLEFTGANSADQVGIGVETVDPRVVIVTNSGADSRSGDLVFGVCAWPGANPTPATITLTGNDGSGAALALNTSNNASTSLQIPWMTGWAQAGGAAGPGGDTMIGSLSEFDFGIGVIASFRTTLPEAAPALEISDFGSFNAIGPSNIIVSVKATISQYSTSLGMTISYQLWNGSIAQIGTTQPGITSTSSSHVDTVTFTGATYSELPNLVLRVYANQGAATTGAIQYVDAASLSVIYK